MRLPWMRVKESVPDAVRAVVPGGRPLAHVRTTTGRYLVAAVTDFMLIDEDGQVLVQRSWVEVDSAVWQAQSGTITVQWVGAMRPDQWRLAGESRAFADAVKERVTRSVVVAVDVEEEGRSLGRAAIRRDPATQELRPQVIWARGIRPGSPERDARAWAVLANLCEQVGIDPPPAPGGGGSDSV